MSSLSKPPLLVKCSILPAYLGLFGCSSFLSLWLWLFALELGKKNTPGWKVSSLKGKVGVNPDVDLVVHQSGLVSCGDGCPSAHPTPRGGPEALILWLLVHSRHCTSAGAPEQPKGLKIHLWRNKITSESFQGFKPFFVLLKGCLYALSIFFPIKRKAANSR